MNLFVYLEAIILRETLLTLVAGILSIFCVNSFVYLKVISFQVTLLTLVAGIRSISCLNYFVDVQNTPPQGSCSRVSLFVIFQVISPREGLVAYFTLMLHFL